MNIFRRWRKYIEKRFFILFGTRIEKWYHLDISQHEEESYMAKTAFPGTKSIWKN